MRILSLPPTINTEQIGRCILRRCRALFRITQVQEYDFVDDNSEEVHQSLLNFHHILPPLHKACLETNVSVQSIHDCIRVHGRATAFAKAYDGMTPFHILAMNPHTSPASFVACLELNICAAVVRDDYLGLSPIDYLWEYSNIECIISLIQVLCLHREANSESDIYIGHDSKRQRVK